MPISDLVRLRNLCIDYGVSFRTIQMYGIHDTLDILDRRAGIGTRGGTVQEFWGKRPVWQVGKRIQMHENLLETGFTDATVIKNYNYHPSDSRHWEAPTKHQHYFHLGAEG